MPSSGLQGLWASSPKMLVYSQATAVLQGLKIKIEFQLFPHKLCYNQLKKYLRHSTLLIWLKWPAHDPPSSPYQRFKQYRTMLKIQRNNFEWRVGGRWVLHCTVEWLAEIWSKKASFSLECLNIFALGSSPGPLLPCLSCQWKVIGLTKKYTWPGLKAGILWDLNLPTGDYWLKEFNKLASISSGCIEKIHTIYRNNQILLGG